MSNPQIHPLACVDPKAELGRDVVIGPFCLVGPQVTLGDGCILHDHVTLVGRTTVGSGNVFFAGSAVGTAPQDLKYRGGDTRTLIGQNNVFREQVTVHAGTEVAGGITRIGSDNRFLVGVHIAHDADVGNECILSNYVQLAGHVRLEDRVTIGGLVGIAHFVTIGTLAYVGGLTRIVADVPPFMIVEGNPSQVRGFNRVALKRWAYAESQIRQIRDAYSVLFGKRAESKGTPMTERLAEIEARTDLNGDVRYLCASIRRSMQDGINGRYLESRRQDSDADRAGFYQNQKNSKDQQEGHNA